MRRRSMLRALLVAALTAGACSAGGGPVRTTGDPAQTVPGAQRGAAPPEVRVRLTAVDREGHATVRVGGAWQLRGLDGRSLAAGRGLDGELTLSGAAPTLAGRSLPAAGAVLRPATPGDLRIGSRAYPGELRIAQSVDGRRRPYVVMDLETYVAGVVPGEIPATFPREAQRTQAILARTYALSAVPAATIGAPIVVADSGGVDQEYHGTPAKREHRAVAADAAQSTRVIVLFDGAEPLRAWYHSTCGGHTAAASTVFGVSPRVALSGVTCTWCTSSRYYRWTASLAGADIVRAAGLTGTLEAFAIAERDTAGRATAFRVTAGGRDRTVPAAPFRIAVGPSALRSCLLTSATVAGRGAAATLRVAGRGWGHGVGLCQIGAKTLAEQALLAEDILRTYYPGVQVVHLW